MNDLPRQKWHDLLRTWAVAPILADRTFEDVRDRYAEPGRFYHVLDHVLNVIEIVESLGSHSFNPHTVQLAAWLHDVIYDSRASDNEERSADYAQRFCEELSIAEGDRVAALIMKTKTHQAGENDPDAEILLDADLAVLGASEEDYRDYSEKIRQEYAWVPEADYRQGRRRVLESFLSRTRIYHWLRDREEPARRNLAAEIAQLKRG
jgi:predicted metal-dependent HD superfamily phosphohydrolase